MTTQTPHLNLIMALGAGVLLVSGSACASDDQAALQLVERYSVTLPESTFVTGLAVGADGRLSIWNEQSGYIALIDSSGALSTLCVGAKWSPISVATTGNGHVTAVEATGRIGLVSQAINETCHLESVEVLDFAPRIATFVNHKWFVEGSAQETGQQLYLVDLKADSAREIRRITDSTPGFAFDQVRATAGFNSLLLTSLREPYSWLEINWTGSVLNRGQPDKATILKDCGLPDVNQSPSWIAIGTVKFEKIYLQTLADEKSDARCLVLYSEEVPKPRATVIHVPLAFTATRVNPTNGSEELVGMRRLDVQEVVVYDIVSPERGSWNPSNPLDPRRRR